MWCFHSLQAWEELKKGRLKLSHNIVNGSGKIKFQNSKCYVDF